MKRFQDLLPAANAELRPASNRPSFGGSPRLDG